MIFQHIARYIEDKIIYKNSKKILPLISELENKVLKKEIIVDKDRKLTYWHIKGKPDLPKVLFCHGNLDNISHVENQKLLAFLSHNGYEVFAIDYRGFGESEGIPEEMGLYSDVETLVGHLAEEYNINNEELILWGHSLGSAVVIDVASKKDFASVIIDGAFTSIDDMRAYLFCYYKEKNDFFQSLLYKNFSFVQKYESKEKISKINSSILIVHSEEDEIVPFEMGVKLHDLKPEAKTHFVDKGSHVVFGWQKNGILEFLKSIDIKIVS